MKKCYILLIMGILLPYQSLLAQHDCDYNPFLTPLWLSNDLIVVAGCSGIQFYDTDLVPVNFIELPHVKALAESATGHWLAVVQWEQSSVLTEDGTWLTAHSMKQISFIDTESQSLIYTIDFDFPVHDIVWHPNEDLLGYVSNDEDFNSILGVIDINAQEIIFEQSVNHSPHDLTWNDDGYINYIGVEDLGEATLSRRIYQWLPGTEPEQRQVFPINIQRGMFSGRVWTPSNTEFVFMLQPVYPHDGWADGGPIGLWNIESQSAFLPVLDDFYFSSFMDIAWHPTGEFFALSTPQAVHIVDSSTLTVQESFLNATLVPDHEISVNDCTRRYEPELSQWVSWNTSGNLLIISNYCRLQLLSYTPLYLAPK